MSISDQTAAAAAARPLDRGTFWLGVMTLSFVVLAAAHAVVSDRGATAAAPAIEFPGLSSVAHAGRGRRRPRLSARHRRPGRRQRGAVRPRQAVGVAGAAAVGQRPAHRRRRRHRAAAVRLPAVASTRPSVRPVPRLEPHSDAGKPCRVRPSRRAPGTACPPQTAAQAVAPKQCRVSSRGSVRRDAAAGGPGAQVGDLLPAGDAQRRAADQRVHDAVARQLAAACAKAACRADRIACSISAPLYPSLAATSRPRSNVRRIAVPPPQVDLEDLAPSLRRRADQRRRSRRTAPCAATPAAGRRRRSRWR